MFLVTQTFSRLSTRSNAVNDCGWTLRNESGLLLLACHSGNVRNAKFISMGQGDVHEGKGSFNYQEHDKTIRAGDCKVNHNSSKIIQFENELK